MFSPLVNHDQTWLSVKESVENEVDVHETDDGKFYFDHYDAETHERLIQNQTDLIKHMKHKNMKPLYSILIIIDDFADDPSFSRH